MQRACCRQGGRPAAATNVWTSPTHLRPKLLDILQDHVAVPVKSFHPAQQLPVVPAVYEDLHQGLWAALSCDRGQAKHQQCPVGRATPAPQLRASGAPGSLSSRWSSAQTADQSCKAPPPASPAHPRKDSSRPSRQCLGPRPPRWGEGRWEFHGERGMQILTSISPQNGGGVDVPCTFQQPRRSGLGLRTVRGIASGWCRQALLPKLPRIPVLGASPRWAPHAPRQASGGTMRIPFCADDRGML